MTTTSKAPSQPIGIRALLRSGARAAGVGSLAGALSGIAWGLLARGAMRLIAREMRRLPSFSIAGTLLIISLGVVIGTLIGIAYAGLRPLVPGGRVWKGLALGVALLLTIGVLLYLGPLVQEGNPQVAALATGLFAASLLAWGALLEALYQPLDRRLLRPSRTRARSIIDTALLALPALFSAAILAAAQLGSFEE